MPFLNAWKKNLARYVETWIGVSVGIFLLGGIFLGLPMLLEASSDFEVAPYLLTGGAIAFLVIVFGGTAFYAFFILRRRRQLLDSAFVSVNIVGKAYSINGRQYHGIYQNRQVDSYFFRGPTLEIYVSTSMQTRLGAGMRNKLGTFLANLADRTPLALAEPEYKEMEVIADDGAWAAKWLAESEVKSALAKLMTPADNVELRILRLQPGAIRLTVAYTEETRITPEAVQPWLEALASAAAAAERLPAPETSSTPLSALERTSQENRGAFTLPAFLFVLGILLLPTICIVVALIVIVTMPSAR
jgi:hypothetical protein